MVLWFGSRCVRVCMCVCDCMCVHLRVCVCVCAGVMCVQLLACIFCVCVSVCQCLCVCTSVCMQCVCVCVFGSSCRAAVIEFSLPQPLHCCAWHPEWIGHLQDATLVFKPKKPICYFFHFYYMNIWFVLGALAEAKTNTNRPQNRTLMSHAWHGHIFYATIPYKYIGWGIWRDLIDDRVVVFFPFWFGLWGPSPMGGPRVALWLPDLRFFTSTILACRFTHTLLL